MIETFTQLKEGIKKTDIIEFILKSQIEQTGLSREELISKINLFKEEMKNSIKQGLKASSLSKSGLAGEDTNKLLLNQNLLPDLISPYLKRVLSYSLAVIEQNARMGKIVACPTAGSSGIVPSVLMGALEEFNIAENKLTNSLILAGEIGRIISVKVAPAGATAGCQAECGTASSMAAGALCYLFDFDIDTILNASALVLKNLLGLVCDPVSGLVEVPCVKRNAVMAGLAVNCAYLAMNGIQSKIPIDDVVDAMREVGNLMSPKLKESSQAGLATTKTGLETNELINKTRNI